MSKIVKYTKNNKTYYKFRVYTGINPKTGKKTNTTKSGFSTLSSAKKELARITSEVHNGTYWEEKNTDAPETVGQLFDEFIELKSHSLRGATIKSYVSAKAAISSALDIKLNQITVKDILNPLSKKQSAGSSCSTINLYLSSIKSVFRYATSQGYIKINTIEQIQPFSENKIKEKRINVYTKEELQLFLNRMEKYSKKYYTIFRLIAFTGLRRGEACALDWDDIDFENQKISITKTASPQGNTFIIGSPKTQSSIRTISLDDKTTQILKEWKKISYQNNYVFSGRYDTFLKPSALNRTLDYFYKKNPDLKQISVHGFRHTHASLLFSQGLNPKFIQKRLGHQNIEMTLNVYVHLYEDDENENLTKIMDIFKTI